MDDYTFSLGAKAIAKQLAKEITHKVGTSTEQIRQYIYFGYEMISKKKSDTSEKIEHNNATLSKPLADEKNSQLSAELKQYISDVKTVCNAKLNDIMQAKRNNVRSFMKLLPTDYQIKSKEVVDMREGKLDEYEWQEYIADMSTNYQASKILEVQAARYGLSVVSPWNIPRITGRLDEYENMARMTINTIDNPDDPLTMTFLKSESGAFVSLMEEIDSDFATIIPAEKLTVLKRLEQAKQRAYDTDNVRLSTHIQLFIENNKTKLATPEEINEELFRQAEEFISKGMNAKKGDE